MLLFVHGVFGYGLEKTALAERREAVVGHDQVVVEIDPDQLAGPLHGAGELEVLGGRLELARGVVVNQDQAEGVRQDGGLEDLGRPGPGRVQRADGGDLEAVRLVLGVEAEDGQDLTVGPPVLREHGVVNVSRPRDPLHRESDSTVADLPQSDTLYRLQVSTPREAERW